MKKLFALTLLGLGVSALAFANPAPEIDPGSGLNAIALVAGAILLYRGRRKN